MKKERKYRGFWDDGHDSGEIEYYSTSRNYSEKNLDDMKREYFTVTIEFKSYPADQAYYLTHDIFYSDFDISESFQDDCLFDIKELEMVKNYLEKDSASFDYNYKINLED